jgi:hypothetical protein
MKVKSDGKRKERNEGKKYVVFQTSQETGYN